MKKFLLYISLISCFTYAQTPSNIPTDGLYGYWPLDGNINDFSGNENHGTTDGNYSTDTYENGEQSVYLQNQLIVLPSSNDLNVDNFTVQFWTKAVSYNIHNKVQFGEINSNSRWVLNWADSISPLWNSSLLYYWPSVCTTYADFNNSVYETSIDRDVWHLLTFVVEGQSTSFYRNGDLITTLFGASDLTCYSDEMSIYFGGDIGGGAIEYYNGWFDNIGIWTRSLTNDEVELIYSSTISSCDYQSSFFDQEDNVNQYINYGDLDWSVNEVKVTTYRDGTPIPLVTDQSEWGSQSTGAYCYVDNDPDNNILYNYYAIIGKHDNDPNTPNKSLAPDGWRMPSDADWNNLIEFISDSDYASDGNVAMAMASTSGWANSSNQGAPGFMQSENNSSCFNAYPNGTRGVGAGFNQQGETSEFWSTDELTHYINFAINTFINTNNNPGNGKSARFVRDFENSCVSDGTFIDQENNVYDYVNYGTQSWSTLNAATEIYRDGTPIPQVTNLSDWINLTTGAWTYFENDPTKGKLYNWYAVAGIHDNDPTTPNKQFAPEGWRVPNKEDWIILQNYLVDNGFNYDNSLVGNKIAKAMASKSGWIISENIGDAGNQQNSNNSSCFNAFPYGMVSDSYNFINEGSSAIFWTSENLDSNNSYYRDINSNVNSLGAGSDFNPPNGLTIASNRGCSVRLVKDLGCTTSTPTGDVEQTFCDTAIVADLTATGESVQWYDVATGGNLLDSTTVLTDGQTVYASQTINGCESTDRLEVTVLIQDITITASATEICAGESVDLSISTIDVEYFNWDDNEPNDTAGIENVVHIQPSGKWNDNGSESYSTNAIFELNYEVSELGNLIFLGHYNNHSYFYENQSLTWPEANQMAESYNTYLLNINTAEENEFIVSSVNNLGLVLDAWLGMIQDENDELYSEPSGGWKWLNSNYLNPEDYSYIWSTGDTAENITVTPTETTEYWVDVTTNGVTCRKYITISVQEITINASATEVCAGESVDLTISSGLTAGSAVCTSSDLPTNLQNGLVGYWPFCGNANDESGNGNNGTVNGATLTTDRFGNPDSAYSFDSVDDYLTIDSNNNQLDLYGNCCITISGWINIENTNNQYGIFTNSGFNVIHQQYALKVDANNKLYFLSGNGLFEANGINYSTSHIELNQWTHTAVTYDGSTLKLYLNGNLEFENQVVDYFPESPSEKVFIGNSWGANNELFPGDIDDLAIWNRALTTSEIQQLTSSSTYTWSTGDITENITITPTETTEYWVDVTTNGVTCREYITINVTALAAPTGDTEQTFCNAATIADLTAEGDNIQWYDALTGGNLLDSSAILTDGQMVYASQTVNGCESTDRLEVSVSIQDITITASASEVCAGESVDLSVNLNLPTICDMQINLTDIPLGQEIPGFTYGGFYNEHYYYVHNDPTSWTDGEQICRENGGYLVCINDESENTFVSNLTNNNIWIGLLRDPETCEFRWLDCIDINYTNWRPGEPNNEPCGEPYTQIIRGCSFGYNTWNNLGNNSSNGACYSNMVPIMEIDPEIYQTFDPSTTYLWSTGDTTETISVTPTETTEYWVDVTTNGVTCREYITISVQEITINASATEVCAGESVDLTLNSGLTAGTTACTSSDLPTNLQNGLVGYWPFCGNANDESGNGNNGTVNGAILTSDRFGEDDNAYLFDGINDWVSLNGPIQDMTNFTISAWVYHTGESYSGIFSDANGVPGEDVFFNMSPSEVGVHADKQSTNLKSLVIPGPLSGPSAFVTSQDFNGQWQNILWTLSPTESKIYINGINVAIIDATGSNIGNHDSNPSIGRLTDNFTSEFYPTQYFTGKLDDFIIWSRTLSESEIQQLTNFSTYTWSTGETTTNITVTPTETTEYWVDVTTNGVTCREHITINVTVPPAPTGNSVQGGCSDSTVGSNNNAFTGENLQWYAAPSGGTALPDSHLLADGTYYYISQTVNGCESSDRFEFLYLAPQPTITIDNSVICEGDIAIVSVSSSPSLGSATFLWNTGETSESITLSPTESSTFWVDQIYNSGGPENIQTVCSYFFEITVDNAPEAPISGGDILECETIAAQSLFATASANAGESITWYDAATGGNVVANPSLGTAGTVTFFAEAINDTSGCSSLTRTAVTLTITSVAAPTGDAVQSFCDNVTVSELLVTGSNIQWYDAATGGNGLDPSSALANEQVLYASQTQNGCESLNRLEVNVEIDIIPDPILINTELEFCLAREETLADLEIDDQGFALELYDSFSGGNMLPMDTLLEDGVSYYATLYDAVSGCESLVRLEVVPTVIPCEVIIYNALSLNGNGQNDYMVIENAEYFPDNSLEVYNRDGHLIYSQTQYGLDDNLFRGVANVGNIYGGGTIYNSSSGSNLPTGSYLYVFKYFNPYEQQQYTLKGFLTINSN